MAVAATLAAPGSTVVSSAVDGQEATGDAEVRIVARKLDSGRIEFGLQQRQAGDTWGDRQLPRVRFFPTTARVNRWLASSPLTLRVPQAAAESTTPQTRDTISAVTVGKFHSCGLRTDGAIACWGSNADGRTNAPTGQHTTVTSGADHACAVRVGGTITCWGNNDHGQTDAPSGQYTAVATGTAHSCGVRTDDTITCWGHRRFGQSDPPSGEFRTVAAGTITCWGSNGDGQADAPAGEFVAVTASGFHACGLQRDGTIVCWGALQFRRSAG